jgi:hypothetical protein
LVVGVVLDVRRMVLAALKGSDRMVEVWSFVGMLLNVGTGMGVVDVWIVVEHRLRVRISAPQHPLIAVAHMTRLDHQHAQDTERSVDVTERSVCPVCDGMPIDMLARSSVVTPIPSQLRRVPRWHENGLERPR